MTTPLLGVVCHRGLRFDTVYTSTCMQNLTILASAVQLIAALKFKVGHVTLTTPFKGDLSFFYMLGLHIAYMHAKFNHSSCSRSGDMVGGLVPPQI